MSLSTEFGRPAKISPPVPPKKKCALETEADRIAKQFGGVASEPVPPGDELARVEAALDENGLGLNGFGRQELKLVPYIIWGGRNAKWRDDRRFVSNYLDLATQRWPTGRRRLWRHYLLNFDPECAATREFATWLATRRDKTPELLRNFAQTYSLLEVGRAADSLATAALCGQPLLEEFERIGLSRDALRTSSLLVAILAVVGRQLTRGGARGQPIECLQRLLDGKPNDVLAQAQCSSSARDRALRSLVDGLVAWQKRHDPEDARPEPALAFLISLNCDPRFERHRWEGRVAAQSIAAVERWLCRETIEAFF